jgi:hypothetical protein
MQTFRPAQFAGDRREDNYFTFAGASDGDTTALGVPNARMSGGGNLVYTAWVSAANTITVRSAIECLEFFKRVQSAPHKKMWMISWTLSVQYRQHIL